MDSGNSGSLQLSSDEAEEECDSLATNNNQQPHQPAPPLNHHLIFDQNQIINNNINPFFFTPNPQQHNQLLNLDSVIWSKTLPSFSDHHFPPATATTVTTEQIPQPPPPPPRNPRKRSRASRRAPTTVLTTDTNNFRAMVQEFTGIPSPPFTSSSSVFPRLMNSFDLFGRPSPNNNKNLDNLPQLPSYLIKPSPSSLLENTMQNTIMFPSSSSINQSLLFLNPKSTQNICSSNVFGVMGENQVHGTMPTKTKARNDDQEIIEPWVSPSD